MASRVQWYRQKRWTVWGIEMDAVVSIEVDDDTIIKRMSGRRVCSCGSSYHIDHKPSADGIHCDKCGKELTIRKDDTPEGGSRSVACVSRTNGAFERVLS